MNWFIWVFFIVLETIFFIHQYPHIYENVSETFAKLIFISTVFLVLNYKTLNVPCSLESTANART